MKKAKMLVIFVVPLLMLLFFNILLAGQAASSVHAKVKEAVAEPELYGSSVISDVDALADPITGLAISHSTPVDLNEPVFFTATVTGGTEPIFYSWNFGDGSGAVLPDPLMNNLISHTYTVTGNYTIVLTAANFGTPRIMTASMVLTVEDLPEPPPPNVSFTYSKPITVNQPVIFTATVMTGTPPIFYRWNFGDGTEISPTPPTAVTISHIYTSEGFYTVALSATNFSTELLGAAIDEVEVRPVSAPPGEKKIFIPLLLKDLSSPQAADLACTYVVDTVTGANGEVLITVQIKNEGQSEADGFWVDAYFNPVKPPSENNLGPWKDACGGNSSCSTGIAWGIRNAPLAPGGSRNLVSIPDDEDPYGFDPDYTIWTGRLPTPLTSMYVYVDSINNQDGKNDGAVSESNEGNNLCEQVDTLEPAREQQIQHRRSDSTLPAR
ncbi:MAG: PKD domain-containing protein [Anaerolineae bacterium]|nr:PKD domain-containing protein [Anaerolineae bacterium]